MPDQLPNYINQDQHSQNLTNLQTAIDKDLLRNTYDYVIRAINQPHSQAVYELAAKFLETITDDTFDTSQIYDQIDQFFNEYSNQLQVDQHEQNFIESHTNLSSYSAIKQQTLQNIEQILGSPEKDLVIDNDQLQQAYNTLKQTSNQLDQLLDSIAQIDGLQNVDQSFTDALLKINVNTAQLDNDLDSLLSHFNLSLSFQSEHELKNILIQADQLSQSFHQAVESVQQLTERGVNETNILKAKKRQINDLEFQLGLDLQIGTTYSLTDPQTGATQKMTLTKTIDITPQNRVDSLLQIQQSALDHILSSIHHQNPDADEQELLNLYISDPNQTPDYLKSSIEEFVDIYDQLEEANNHLASPNVYTSYEFDWVFELEDGQEIVLNQSQIEGFFSQFNVLEHIAGVNDLLEKINFAAYGQTITAESADQPGTVFEQRVGLENPEYKYFTVKQLTDSHITLDPEVEISTDADGTPLKKSTLTLSEFSQWYKKNHVEQKMSLYQAQMLLENQPTVLKNKYPDTPPSVHIFADEGIKIEAGEKIIARDKTTYTINSVDTDENGNQTVTLDTGRKMTIPEFVNFCKKYECEPLTDQVTDPTTGQKIDNPAKKDSKSAEDEAEKRGMNLLQMLPSLNLFQDPLDILGLHFMTFNDYAAIGSMLKESWTKYVERKDKERLNKLGSTIPGEIGRQFADSQSSINGEKIQNEKSRIETDTIADVLNKLHKAPDRFKAKAHMDFLADRGSLDLNSSEIHKRLNFLLKKHQEELDLSGKTKYKDLLIKDGFNSKGDQGKNAAITALNALYGGDSGVQLANTQESKYSSECSSWENVMREEQGKENFKPVRMIHDLLYECHNKRGSNDVSPAQYQGFLDAAMMMPYLDKIEDVMFFIIAGMATKNQYGQSLLTDAYLSKLKRNDLPVLDYIARFTRKRGLRSLKLQGIAPEILAELKPNFSRKGLTGKDQRYDMQLMQNFLFLDVIQDDKTKARVQDSVDKGVTYDKDHTAYSFIGATPTVMKNILALDAPQGQYCRFGMAHLQNSFEGFNSALQAISNFEQNPKILSALGDVSKYSSLTPDKRALHAAELLGSWYYLFSQSKPSLVTAFGKKASSAASSFKGMSPKKLANLDKVADQLSPIIEHYFPEMSPYLLGKKDVPDGLKDFVFDFPDHLLASVAQEEKNPKILELIKGLKFT